MEPIIVQQLRSDNAALKAENARLRRQEAWVFAVAARRVRVLEAGLQGIADTGKGFRKRVRRILDTPQDWMTT
jgi:hypothetical protein